MKININHTILLGILATLTLFANAQPDKLDSIAKSISPDTLKVKAALSIVEKLEQSNYNDALSMALWALQKSESINYDWGVVNAYYWLASMEYENQNPSRMHAYIDTIMTLTDYTGFQKILGDVYNLQGIAYYNENDLINALRYWEKALELTPRNKSSGIYSNIGNIYLSNEKFDEALKYYLKAIEVNIEQSNQNYLVINYINIARCYTSSDTEQVYYLKTGEQTARQAEYFRMLPFYFFDLANYYSSNFEFHQSSNFMDSLKFKMKTEEWLKGLVQEAEAHYMYFLAQYRTTNKELPDDSVYLNSMEIAELYKEALLIYERLTTNADDYRSKMYFNEQQANINTQLKDYEAATRNFQLAYQYKDSMAQNQSLFQLKQLELEQEEAEKREAELLAKQEHQKQRNRLTIVLAGSGIIILIAIGLLGRLRFVNRTNRIIQNEKNRSDELLHNILPAEVAAELKEKGESEARDFDNVTVVFTDFMAFTETAQKMTAKELVQEINTCFKTFDEIIGKYGIEKIKTIGDAYMAAGGLNMPRKKEEQKVVMAALEMQNFMFKRKVLNNKSGLPAFEMRVGIHTGPVVAGIVGVKKFQYDIWGDTVNIASRMESNGEAGKVNISNDTYELIKSESVFEFENRGKIEVKGKGEMEMLFVTLKK